MPSWEVTVHTEEVGAQTPLDAQGGQRKVSRFSPEILGTTFWMKVPAETLDREWGVQGDDLSQCLASVAWTRQCSALGFTKDIVQVQRDQRHDSGSRVGGQLLMVRCLGNKTRRKKSERSALEGLWTPSRWRTGQVWKAASRKTIFTSKDKRQLGWAMGSVCFSSLASEDAFAPLLHMLRQTVGGKPKGGSPKALVALL